MKWFTRVDLLLILALAVLVPFAIAESPVLGSSGDRVEGVTASPGAAAGELIVSWDEPTSAPLDYRVSWAPEGESFKATSQTEWNAYPTSNQHTITGLEAGASYKVKVRARYGADGRSDWSQIVYGTVASNSPDVADSANPEQSLVFVPDQEPETAQQNQASIPTTIAECRRQMIDGLALSCSANRFTVKTMRHDGTYHFDWSVWASQHDNIDRYTIQRQRFSYRHNFTRQDDGTAFDPGGEYAEAVPNSCVAAGAGLVDGVSMFRWQCDSLSTIYWTPEGAPTTTEEIIEYEHMLTIPRHGDRLTYPGRFNDIPVEALRIPTRAPQSLNDQLTQQELEDTIYLLASEFEMHLYLITVHFEDGSTESHYALADGASGFPDQN